MRKGGKEGGREGERTIDGDEDAFILKGLALSGLKAHLRIRMIRIRIGMVIRIFLNVMMMVRIMRNDNDMDNEDAVSGSDEHHAIGGRETRARCESCKRGGGEGREGREGRRERKAHLGQTTIDGHKERRDGTSSPSPSHFIGTGLQAAAVDTPISVGGREGGRKRGRRS